MNQASVSECIPSERAIEGDGFVVRRPFPTLRRSHIDPFLLFDHMGPVTFGPGEGVGTPWHPHRGFETVTYMLDGHAEHLDSMGNRGTLGPGDTQWMTAGSGVLHKEGPSEEVQRRGGTHHGLQLWVNLPRSLKMMDAAYQDLRASAIPSVRSDGAVARVIAGTLFGITGPGATHTPIAYGHLTLESEAAVTTALAPGHNRLVYPMVGAANVGGTLIDEGILAILDDGEEITITGASETPAEVILLTGEPIGEPVARMGPFVMNTETELRQAMLDYQRGDFGLPIE